MGFSEVAGFSDITGFLAGVMTFHGVEDFAGEPLTAVA